MLIQSKRIKDNIISCGIKKSDVSVHTPFNFKCKGYGKTNICIYSNDYNHARYILRLRKYFNLIVIIKNHEIASIHIIDEYVTDGENGKIRFFDLLKNDFTK